MSDGNILRINTKWKLWSEVITKFKKKIIDKVRIIGKIQGYQMEETKVNLDI